MQLTRLEIKGFKSFGDKVTINFDEGITSIVGPNGCGKSNVVDAIRWVLGEQSTKALRSEKMENIIFNGTNTRKAAQLAEVSLSFNNTKNILPTDFSQVTITRKLYRNGDSEYRLNDVQCRLKDITDLFLDTGIGSDSYAIIELKMVEEIINNKDHSRRNLFEEASGISKYKIRKRQTLTRLKETENDLSRVEDLLYEIEKNLKALENQAKKTERYYKLKEQYKSWSLSLTALKISGTQKFLKDIQAQILEEETKRVSISNEIDTSEASLQQMKQENLIKEQNLSTQQKKLNQHITEIRNFETEKKIKNEQLNNFQKREEQLNKELTQDKQQKNHILYQKKRLLEESLEASNLLTTIESELESQLQEVESLRGTQSVENEKLDNLNKSKNTLQKEVYELEKQITILTIQGDALRQESRRSDSDEQSREDELSVFNEKLFEINSKTEALEDSLYTAQENENALTESIANQAHTIEHLKEQHQQHSRLVDAKTNEYNLTKSMVDNLEGFPESIRFLRKSKNWDKDIPLFSDILLCKEEYRVAIENLLEPYMNYYVVESFKEAYSAINLLNDSGKGKAGFFILESLPQLTELTTATTNLIPALTVIEVDKKYALLCSHLLHSVYIQDKPNADDETDNLPFGDFVFLDANGKYIKKTFSISGGSVGLFEGKRIGRTKNLEKFAQEIKKLKTLQENAEFEIKEKGESLVELKKQTQKQLIEEYQLQLQRLKNEYISIKTKQEQYEAFIKDNLEKKQNIENKIAALEVELKEANPQLLALQTERSILEKEVLENQEQFRLLSDELLEKSSLYNQTNIRYHQQNNKVSGFEKDIEYREIQIETIEKQIEQKEKEFQEIQDAIKAVLQHVDLSDDDLISLYEEKEGLEKGLQELEQVYYSSRGKIIELEEAIQILRKNKEISDTLLNELKDQKNKFHLELNAFKERLSAEFSFDIDELQDPEEINENEHDLSERIVKIKKQLDDFGAINPMAMEAFKEMDERYQFIQSEKSDLIEAKTTLLKTIQEIDLNAEEKFMEAFVKVRENFKIVFRSLFNEEDTCDLIITDPENPLDSDIDIIARPKGKRPLSINQLSGGEKTLTSTALLFSLYLLKPAPFCIFDEIDAPLDDTNIDKFNNIIREFSDNSQFIIVSHNKRTIASTDIIYGVTMVEPGISRVVAVDLRESIESIRDINQTV
jgi:chromosome segregation protein